MRTLSSLLFALVVLPACGGSPAPQATAPSSSAAEPEASATPPPETQSPAPESFPSACADKSADVCTPSGGFVERLCAKSHQDAALALFATATPFTRLYLRGKMDELSTDEEVLALKFHGAPKGGMQVGSGNGSYDVLRWDGTCSMAVDADLLTKNKPPRTRAAHPKWHRIGDKLQTALIVANEGIKKLHAKRGKECQGAMSGDVSSACEKADSALADAVVEYVRAGGSLPAPDSL